MKSRIINFVITLCICCFGMFGLAACSDPNKSNFSKQVPIYQGISFENQATFNNMYLSKLSHNDEDDDEDEDIDDKDVSDIIVKDFGTIEMEEIVQHGVKSEKAYLVLNFHNPAKYEILSFVMNGEKYQSYQFNENSTSEKIRVAITLPNTSGVYEYKIQEIKYIDGDDIEDCRIEGNTSVKVGVMYDNPPKAISSVNVGYNSVEVSTNIIDNSNIIASSKGKVKFYIFNSNSAVYSKDLSLGMNDVKFNGLKQNKRYKYVVAAIYDSLDGNGIKTHILETDFFTTKSYVSLDVIEIGKNNIKICVNKNLEEVSIDSVDLWKDNSLIKTSKETNIDFTNLLSNSQYRVRINYSNNGKNFQLYKNIKTLTLDNPVINISSEPLKNSIKYVVDKTDTDNVITSYKINLKQNNKILKTLNTLDGEFNNLLSNTTYQIELEYVCDMRNGNNNFSNIQSYDVKTLALQTPSCGLDLLVSGKNLTGKLVLNDVDNIFKLKNIELRTINNELKASTTNTNINFEISPNVSYIVIANFTYDLNDGTGEKEGKIEKKILTNKLIPSVEMDITPSDISAYFNLIITDTNSVGAVDSVKLYKDNTFLKNISVTENEINELISNTEYKLLVKYRYDFNDGAGAKVVDFEKSFKTLKTLPKVSLENIDLTTSSIKVNPVITDNDNAGSISKIELYKNNELLETKTKDYLFTNLLSNNDYVIKCFYTYDLNNGTNELVVIKNVKTSVNKTPAVDLILTSTLDKISYKFVSNDNGIIANFSKVELYKNQIKYAESSTQIGEFLGLLSDCEYVLKVIYTYDLNDGKGVITASSIKVIKTKIKAVPKVGIQWTNLIDVLAEGQINVLDESAKVQIRGIFLYKNTSIIQSITNNSSFSFMVEPNSTYNLCVKYTYDLNDGMGIQECEEKFEFTTTKQIPNVNIVISEIDIKSIDYKLDFIDVNNNGAIKGIKLYQGGIFIKQMNEFDTHIDGLTGNTEYKFVVNYLYDLNDGLGSKSVTYEKTFRTLKTMPSYNMNLSKDGISINLQHNLVDVDGVATFNSVKVYSLYNNKLIVEKNKITDTKFTDLLNGNGYRVVVSFDYDLNDGAFLQEFSDVIYLDSLLQPSVNIIASTNKKDINFDYNYIDNDNVVKGKDINIYKGTQLIEMDKQNKIATNLLSNNQYEIRVTLKCDFNDGRGIVDKNYYKYVTTQALHVPSLSAAFLSTSTTITPKYNIIDNDKIITINAIDILKDDTLIQTSKMSEDLVFDQLLSNTVYTFKTYFSYDLNDGNGIHNDIFESLFSTLADDVEVLSHRILNDTAPKTNENVVIQLNIDNASNVAIKQVKVNGVYYSVTGGDNKNNIIFAVDSGNRSGIIHYSIDEMQYMLNGFKVNQKITYDSDISVEVFSRLNVLSVMSIDGMSIAKDTSGIVFEIDNPNGYEIKKIVANYHSYSGISLDNNHYYVNSIDSYYLLNNRNITISSLDYINEQGELATRRYTDSIKMPMVYIKENPDTYAIQTNIINTPEDLISMSDGSYVLGKDIDMTGYNWVPKSFNGVFDGRGHKISNLKYTFETEDPSISVGMFTSLSGTFKNVYIENMYFDITAKNGVHSYFVINNSATIENVVISGGINMKASHTFFTMPTGTNIYLIDGFKVNSNLYQYDSTISLETFNSKQFKENTLGWIFNPIEYKVTNDLKYLVINNAYIVISKYIGNSDNVVVPDVIDGLPVVGVQDFAFANHAEVKSVTLSQNTFYMGGSVFAGCSNLTEILNLSLNKGLGSVFGNVVYNNSYKNSDNYFKGYIPTSLNKLKIINTDCINNSAFFGCSSLTSVNLSNSVTSIGYNAFNGCSSLTSIIIPSGVTSIGSYAFTSCSSLTSIAIPSSLTSIGKSAFEYCSSLTSITIPSGVTSIGDQSFADCSSLIDITLPSNLKIIGKNIFNGCSSLTSINLPNSITSIGDYAFRSCSSLKKVYFYGTIEQWNKINIGKDNDKLLNATKVYIDGNEYTYAFDTKGGTEVKSITTSHLLDMNSISIPTKDGLYFGGWYDNAEYNGKAIEDLFFYKKGGATLYAKWLTQEEYYDGSSFDRAKTINLNSSEIVNIKNRGQWMYFKFVANETKAFTVATNNAFDSYNYLYDENKNQLQATDSESFAYNLESGKTYYIVTRMYSESNTGSYTISIK